MSYKCEFCHKTVEGEQHKVLVKTRNVAYIRYVKDEKGNKKREITYGWEIADDRSICSSCDPPVPIVAELEKVVDCRAEGV